MTMAALKPLEMVHPPLDQLGDFDYCIDSNPPWSESIALGFQHFILALGTAVMIPSILVPSMGGSYGDKARVVQTLLFVEGINTLLQTLFGTRLPTVMGGSYAFMVPIISIMRDPSLVRIKDPHERFQSRMRAYQGALIVSSCLQIILGYSQIWALCLRFFSPLSLVPVISLLGLGLLNRGFPVVGDCVEIGIPMLLLFIALSQYSRRFHRRGVAFLERLALVASIAVIWTYANVLTASGAYEHRPEATQFSCRTDKAYLISTAPWIKVPYPIQWGAPTFNAGHCFGMMAAVLVSTIESTGAHHAASRLASATPPPPHVISRGVGCQGIGTLLSALFGTLSGSSVSIENVGLLGMTRVGSRRIIQVSAGFMIFFSVLGKFGALLESIPFTIFAAAHCVLLGLVASVGLSFMQFTNLNSLRNLFITGVSLFLGLSIPEYFRSYTASTSHGPAQSNAGWFNDFVNTIFASAPTVAMLVATFLDATLERSSSAADRGMPWWSKFQTFNGDPRNEEFYTLPFNLNRFFPAS